MKPIYFAILLLMPGFALAQSSVTDFNKLLNYSGTCQGLSSKFVLSVEQTGLDSVAQKELRRYAQQQVTDYSRIQTRLIEKYLRFLDKNKPDHPLSEERLNKRVSKTALKTEQSDLSADELSAQTSSCADSIRVSYPYMFLYDNPNDKRISDPTSPLNRVVTYFGGFVQCSVIMQKDYAADGGTDAQAVRRSRANLAKWFKTFPQHVEEKLPAASNDAIYEFREILYNSLSLNTQIQWSTMDSKTRQQQVEACISLDKNVQELSARQ